MPSPLSASDPVVVVGGGLSGLSAAVSLASRDLPVVLLEQREFCGGRAYSFRDKTTGDVVDNGQHVLIAGYQHTLRFLERIGTKQLLAVQDRPTLMFHHPERGICELSLPALPSPLHIIVGISATNLLSLRDKLKLLRAGLALHSGSSSVADGMSVEQWLESVGQSAELKRSFWEPLAVAVMNEHVEHASAKIFLNAFHRAFLSDRKSAALALPTVGLSELFVDSAVHYIRSHSGEVRTNADVVEVVLQDDRAAGVRCKDGRFVACSVLILALPHHRVLNVQGSGRSESISSPLALSDPLHSYPSTPIVSIHLWFDKDVMPHDVLGVIGRRVQWVFNRRKISREQRGGGHVSCVISAAHDFVDLSNDELVRIATEDLQAIYPDAQFVQTSALCIREKRATFSCTPDSDGLRPDFATPVRNVFLAGDWTNTRFPATIEGAIMSGEICAHMAAAEVGCGHPVAHAR